MLDPSAQGELVQRARELGASTIRLSRSAFEKVAYREGPDGFLAVVPVAGVALDDLALPADPLVLVCEGLEKPGNLGAVLRTADAAGVAAVVAADPVTDWGNPNVVRASKGTVFALPVASATTAAALAWLAAHDIRLVVTNLAVMDFGGPSCQVRLRSLHAGVTTAQVCEATGFPIDVPAEVQSTPLPTSEQLALLARLDPHGLRASALGS